MNRNSSFFSNNFSRKFAPIVLSLLAIQSISNCATQAKPTSPTTTKATTTQKTGSTAHSEITSPGDPAKPFDDLDALFVQAYNEYAKSQQEQNRPIIVVTGFKYHLLTDKGETKSFQGNASVMPELKCAAHICPAFFAIGSIHWNDLKDKTWKVKLAAFKEKLQLALNSVDQVDWKNDAWPEGESKLKQYVKDALSSSLAFAEKIIAKGEFEREDYQSFATSFTPYMVSLFYLETLAGAYGTIRQLQGWRNELGEDAWGRAYFIVAGSEGRTTAGLTKDNNPAALTIAAVMDPEKVTSNILLAPGAKTIDEALADLGMVLNARQLAEMTFTNLESQKAGGFYDALKTSDTPLAISSLRSILKDLREGKARDPVLGLGPTKPL